MLPFLSITGLFKTLIIIIGVFVLLRFLAQIMNAKRNVEVQNRLKEQLKKEKKEKDFVKRNLGKISISKKNESKDEFTDFEEL